MLDGVITKGIGGFYYVETKQGIYECRARGNFRKKNITPLIGDFVRIEEDEINKAGYVVEILPRKNEMVRPTVSNLDQVVITFAAADPDINMKLMQKLLIYAERIGLGIVVCLNKWDLAGEDACVVEGMLKSIPYSVIRACTKNGLGIDQLRSALENKQTVFAGPSGVGKSSLLNAIQPGLSLKTGDISKKTSRGTHTTRHAELIRLDFGGRVLDTPGFSSLDLIGNDPETLVECFPEFHQFANCRFAGCIHVHEPDCGIKQAVENGKISKIRYAYYKLFFEELKQGDRKKYR